MLPATDAFTRLRAVLGSLRVVLACVALASACAGPPQPLMPTGGASEAVRQARTLGQFLNPLDDSFTRQHALELFGEPDRVVFDLLTYFVYELPDGRQVWLGFPELGPIKYARVKAGGARGDGPP